MKTFSFFAIFCGALYAAQSGKVGINTQTPMETLQVEGTVRVSDLPADKTGKIYNGSREKNTTFTATKMVVANDNGVLGVVSGIPVTSETVSETIKEIAKEEVYKWISVDRVRNSRTDNNAQIYNVGDVDFYTNLLVAKTILDGKDSYLVINLPAASAKNERKWVNICSMLNTAVAYGGTKVHVSVRPIRQPDTDNDTIGGIDGTGGKRCIKVMSVKHSWQGGDNGYSWMVISQS